MTVWCLREKIKRWSTAFRGSTESFSFRQRILKTARQTVSRGSTVLLFISAESFTDKQFRRRLSGSTRQNIEKKNLEKNMDEKEWLAHNKNYMSIGVSVRTTKFAARNNGIGVRQESNPQSPTAYSSVRCA